MTIQKRSIPLPIGAGVDQSKSDVLFDPPLLREAINVRFEKEGAVEKRYGETVVAASLPSAYGEHSTIAEQDGRAVVHTPVGMYVHDEVRSAWTALGNVQPRPSKVKVDSLVRTNNSASEPEIVLVTVNSRTVACVVFCDVDTYEAFYSWFEIPSDGGQPRVLSGPTKFAGTRDFAYAPRLTAIGTVVYAMAGDDSFATNIYTASCDAASTYTFSTPATAADWRQTAVPVALLDNDASALWAVVNESGGGYSIRKLDTSFTQTAVQSIATVTAMDAIRAGSNIIVVLSDGSIDVCADSLAGAPTNYPLVAVTALRATLCTNGTGYFCAWTSSAYGTTIAGVTPLFALTLSGVVGSVQVMGRALETTAGPVLPVGDIVNRDVWRMGYLASPATDAAGRYDLAPVSCHGQDVADEPCLGRLRAFVLSGGASASHPSYVTPSLVYDAASKQYLFPFLTQVGVNEVAGDRIFGVDLSRVSLYGTAPASKTASAQSLRLLATGAGVTYVDGAVHAEVTPAPIGYLANGGLSGIYYTGATTAAALYVALAARWRDEKGNLHRGAPVYSGAVDVFLESPPDDQAYWVSFPRPFPNTVRGDRGGQSYEVEVYASETADGQFYFCDVVTPHRFADSPFDGIVISWNRGTTHVITESARYDAAAEYVADVSLTAASIESISERWSDAELSHVPTPAAVDIVSTQSRAWILSAESGRRHVFPSKQLTPGYAPEFPTALRIVVPDEGGEATALASLTDKVVVFKERLVYVIFGDPGDNTGAGGTVQTPRLVQGDVGCSEALSVVEGPFGVAFRSSAAGFFLLTPGLEIQRLPNLEDDLASYTVTSGVLVADKREVRWSLADGAGALKKTLVWDYEANAWATRTDSIETRAACTVGGQYTRLAIGGNVYTSRDTWSTSLDTHEATLTSAWVKMAGVAGFQRVWKTVYTFRWLTGGIIIRLGYDFNPSYTDTRTWTPANLAALDLSDGTVTLTVHHTVQKCRAFRWQIEEVSVDGQTMQAGQGFSLLGVQMECGVKRGSFAHALAAGARK